MEETLVCRQEMPNKTKRINEYMQNIVSNNNNYKCECCPYGHHVNVDFVEFAKDISNSHNELQKIRRYQRKLERAQSNLLNKSDVYSTFPKESIILSKNLTNRLSCSSSDSNSSDVLDANASSVELVAPPPLPLQQSSPPLEKNGRRSPTSSDVVFLPNNLGSPDKDTASRSSDDSNIQSLVLDHDGGLSIPRTVAKSRPYSSKSFVVSYEHLMSIREQMSTSLRRVQDLEAELRTMHNCRQSVDLLSRENRQLRSELATLQQELTDSATLRDELHQTIVEKATSWQVLSDLPIELLPHIERVLHTCLADLATATTKPASCPVKSTLVQTDVTGSVIIDTISFLNSSNREPLCPQTHPDENLASPKIKRRNFGVTVRPTHHNFSQQISLAAERESLAKLREWLPACRDDIDRRIANLIEKLVVQLLDNQFAGSVALLRRELQSFSFHYKSVDHKLSQTTKVTSCDISNQVSLMTEQLNKSIQICPTLSHKYTEMTPIVTVDRAADAHIVAGCESVTQTDYHSLLDAFVQTDGTATQDFCSFYKYRAQLSDMSSTTDQYLIDDMIAEQIELSIELIHQELKQEIIQSAKQQRTMVVDQLEFHEMEDSAEKAIQLILNTYSEYNDIVVPSKKDQQSETNLPDVPPMKRGRNELSSSIVHSSISGNNQREVKCPPVIHASISGNNQREVQCPPVIHASISGNNQREVQCPPVIHASISGNNQREVQCPPVIHASISGNNQKEVKFPQLIHTSISGNVQKEVIFPSVIQTSISGNLQNQLISPPVLHSSISGNVDNESRSQTVINSSVSGDYSKQAVLNLKRCEIMHSHFDDQNVFRTMDQITCESRQNESKIPRFNNELHSQIFHESDQSDSGGSSPREAIYYSIDGRIEYKTKNFIQEIDEVDEASEDNINTSTLRADLTSVINESTVTPMSTIDDESKPLISSFPQNIEDACQIVAQWMNDSTTTCSKDLNDSLAAIRQFWFEITANNSSDLQFYISKFCSFNPALQERIINMTDLNGNTCLHYAVSEGRWAIVRLLLSTKQVNVNKTNNAGYTVLMLVAVSDNIDEESLKTLIDESHIDKQSVNDTQQTALMIAASQGKTQLVQLLLEKGASINLTDSDGSTALMCACDNGHLEVVRLLLSRPDTDTEMEDNTGSNAMKIALDNAHKDIALLIFARNNLQKGSMRSKRRSGSNSHPTSPLNQRKFK